MGIPLVRNNSVDDINTSIIAIKKELGKGGSSDMGDVNVNVDVKYEVTDTVEDGNSLPVTSQGVYDYVEGQGFTPVDEVEKNNMKAVTSNAVAESLSYSKQVTFYTPTPAAVGYSSSVDFKSKLSTAGYNIDDFDEVTFCIGSNTYNNLGFSNVTILRVEGNRGIGAAGQVNTVYFNWSTGVLDAGLAVHSATFRKYGDNIKIIAF